MNHSTVERSALGFISPINLLYAMFPMCLVGVLTLPVVQDNDVSFGLTDAYSSVIFFLMMLPASVMMIMGSNPKWYRTALAMGIVAIIAVPVVDLYFEFGVLESAGNNFNRYMRALTERTGYQYFRPSRDLINYLGLAAWLIIPVILLNVLALVGYKYRTRTGPLPTLAQIKGACSSVDIKAAVDSLDTGKARSLAQKASDQINTDKVRAFGQELKSHAENIDIDKVTKQVSEHALALKDNKPVVKVKVVALAGIALAMLILGALVVETKLLRVGPTEDEVVEAFTSALGESSEMGLVADFHEYEISDCKEVAEVFHCNVTSKVTMTKTVGKRVTVNSTLENAPRTFKYEDGLVLVELEHIIGGDGLYVLYEAFTVDVLNGFAEQMDSFKLPNR